MSYFTLLRELIRDEGFSRTTYTCPLGKTTIGYGRNLDSVGISEGEALYLLENDIKWIKETFELENGFTPWFKNKPEYVQEVLINMAYNLGIHGLLQFKKSIQLIKDDKYEEAAEEILNSKWAKQVGDRAVRLSLKLKG